MKSDNRVAGLYYQRAQQPAGCMLQRVPPPLEQGARTGLPLRVPSWLPRCSLAASSCSIAAPFKAAMLHFQNENGNQ